MKIRTNNFPKFETKITVNTTSTYKMCLSVWPDDWCIFSTFNQLHHHKFSQEHTKLPKLESKFYQIINKPSKLWPNTLKMLPKWWNYDKSGHGGVHKNVSYLSKFKIIIQNNISRRAHLLRFLLQIFSPTTLLPPKKNLTNFWNELRPHKRFFIPKFGPENLSQRLLWCVPFPGIRTLKFSFFVKFLWL